MKKYIIEYDLYDDLLALLGHGVPHTNVGGGNVSTVIVDLYDEEYEALIGAGIQIIPNTVSKLLYTAPTMPLRGLPDTYSPINDFLNITNSHIAGFDGTGVKVAVLDTGANDSAVTVTPSLIRMDFTGTGVQDDFNHGGKGCNIIGQVNSAFTPYSPISYGGTAKGCQVYSLKVYPGGASEMIAAVSWCISNNIDVINISMDVGGGMTSAINSALAAGIIVVCASGNSPSSWIAHPANIPGVLCINGVTGDDPSIPFGSHMTFDGSVGVTGIMYDVGAAQTYLGGTSQSAFIISALMAVYKQKFPSLNCAKAINLLRRKALKMDGYIYSTSSSTIQTKLNYETGAGFIGPIN